MTTLKHAPQDEDLLIGIKKGNSQSFDQLYKRYYNEMYSYGLKISKNQEITKDAIQEIFLNLWRSKHKADSICFIKIYLLISLQRRLIRQMSLEQKRKNLSCADGRDQISLHRENCIVKDDWNGHVVKLLDQKISELPQRQQQAIRLRFYQGMEYQQMAFIMKVNYQSVLNHLQKSMKNLRTSEQIKQVAYYRAA